MHKLTFKLKQHTPLIHFQHKQHGATLRATELKPKLDKFLIEKFNQNKIDYSSWLIKGQEKALNYKVRIKNINNSDKKTELEYYYFESRVNEDDKEKITKEIKNQLKLPNLEVKAPSSFFANNDKRNNKEYDKMAIGILWTGTILLEIICFIEDLKKLINDKLIQEFFSINNFGNRQSKGFGSFTEENTNEDFFEMSLENNFPFYKKVKNNLNDIYKDIDNIYKKLKNKPPDSKIRDYFADKNIEWEKKFVTKKIVKKEDYTSEKKIMYVRALLGLAELHDYQQFYKKVKIKHIKNGDLEIDRFQSPIIFKVFNNNIYIVVNDKDIEKIKGEWFNFYIGENLKKATTKEELQVPTEFNILEFIKKTIK